MKNYFNKNVNQLKYFNETSVDEWILFVKGLFLCYLFFILTKFFPLKFYMHFLKSKPDNNLLTAEDEIQLIKLVRKTFRRIDKYNFFKFNCLTKSIVFKILLKDFGVDSNVVLGIKFLDEKILAHAYVKVNRQVVFLQRSGFTDIFSI